MGEIAGAAPASLTPPWIVPPLVTVTASYGAASAGTQREIRIPGRIARFETLRTQPPLVLVLDFVPKPTSGGSGGESKAPIDGQRAGHVSTISASPGFAASVNQLEISESPHP